MTLLCSAIATQEGFWSDGSRPMRDDNPGDLRAAPWLTHPKLDGGYWHAASVAEGIAGLFHQVALDIARGMTLRQLIASWAPASDGNATAAYLANVMSWTGIANADTPLWNLLTIRKLG
jgi:hypothetical protein